MQLAQRLALVTAVLSLGAATVACKKEAKKEPAATKAGDGSGSSAAVTADAAAAKPADTPPAAATAALSGFKGAMAKAGGDQGMGGKLGLGGGATGGIGGALGGIFGGGSKAAPPSGAGGPAGGEAQALDDQAPGDDEPSAEPDIKLPPGKAGGDCEAVTDKLMVIVRGYAEAELGSMSPDERKMADTLLADELAKVRGEVLRMCVDEQWSAELRDCVLTAPDMAALENCDQFTPADTAIDEIGDDDDDAPEPVATPAPAWTGGDDCGSVGKRLMQLAMHGMGDIPAEVRAELEAELARSAEEVAAMCTDGAWTVEVRQCVVKSTTMSDAEGCLAKLASP